MANPTDSQKEMLDVRHKEHPWYRTSAGRISVISLAVSLAAAAFTGVQWYNNRIYSEPMQMTIVGIEFSPSHPELTVQVHLINPGSPSTIKNAVLTIFVDNKQFEQFPPREFNTPPTLGHEWGPGSSSVERGPYLSKEPLGQGREIDASITNSVTGEVRKVVDKPGVRFRLTAIDIEGREISADYIR
jgi:hypothetical protein